MAFLRIVPIVEGHGETESIRILLTRIWIELFGNDAIDILRPIRHPSSRLTKVEYLRKAIELAARKLANEPDHEGQDLILILVDADDALPCQLGPELLTWAIETRGDIPIACVLPNKEFETWFVGSAHTLDEFLTIDERGIPDDPEVSRSGKAWIENRFSRGKYSSSIDQPRLTARIDLEACRDRCKSFDKLCRELERFTADTESAPA